MNQRSLTTGVALGIVAFAQACTIRDITEVPVVSVEVQPSSITILEGETQRLTAQARTSSGETYPAGP